MSRVAGALARALAVLLAGLFVVSGAFVAFATGVEQALLNPHTYDVALSRSTRLDEVVPAVVTQYASRSLPATVGGAALRYLNADDWAFVTGRVLPPDDLRSIARQSISDLLAWLESDDETLRLSVAVIDVKVRLAGEPGREILERVMRSWPDCSAEKAAEWLAQPSVEHLPVCLPPEPLRPLALTMTHSLLAKAVTDMPDNVDLLGLSNRPGGSLPAGLLDIKSSVRWLTNATRVGVLIPLALLLVVTLLAVRSPRGLLGWWGTPLLLAGLAATAATLLLGEAVASLLERTVSGAVALPSWAVPIIHEMAPAVAGQVAAETRELCLIVAGAGAAMLVLAAIVPRARAATQG